MKRALLFILTITLIFSSCMNALADDNRKEIAKGKIIKAPYCPTGTTIRIPIKDAEYLDIGNGQIVKIADLPSFSSKTAANAFMHKTSRLAAQPSQINKVKPSNHDDKDDKPNGKVGTNGVQCVASSGTIPCWVSLYISYSTSGPDNTGTITSHSAYTTFAGWTLGISWNQTHITSRISGTKNIYAECAGELVYYLLIEGFIEINRIEINLTGTCNAIK